MSTRDLALASLERAIDALLALDPVARRRLAKHHGKVVGIHLRGPEITLYLVPDQQGTVQLLGQIEGEPDALLSGSPLDLLRSSDTSTGSPELFAGRVTISGDTALAHEFGATLGQLEIDWEEQLSKFTGDVIAHQVGSLTRQTLKTARDTANRLESDLGEYLTEEARLLPHPLQIEDFAAQVDQLRDDTERLEARIKRLEKRLTKREAE